MKHLSIYNAFWALCLLAAACSPDVESGGSGQPLAIALSDEIAATRAGLHVDQNATAFDADTDIQVCIDYYRKDETNPEKQKYVHAAKFTKTGKYFTSPYSIIWLDDYSFDIYAIYPWNVKIDNDDYPGNPNSTYHLIKDVGYTQNSQCFEGEASNWYVTSGATLVTDGGAEASDPHDLITSMVLTRETAPSTKRITFGTDFADHGEDPVQLTFMHRLSRLEPYFVNGMGDYEDVVLRGIAIYPTVEKASFAVKRHEWLEPQTSNKFELRDDGKWYHNTGSDWVKVEGSGWIPLFEAAPIKYEFEHGFKLTSTTAVMAKDKVTVDCVDREPFVEFRMLPDSDIDCMILHFDITNNENNATQEAYLPVHIDPSKNQGRPFLTQMGHTTRLVLSYKATMITLLYVNYNEWKTLPNRFVMGDLNID